MSATPSRRVRDAPVAPTGAVPPDGATDVRHLKRLRKLERRLLSAFGRRGSASNRASLFGKYVAAVEGGLHQQAERIIHCPHAAQDVVQECLLSLYAKLRQRALKGNLYTWLSGVVSNKALKAARDRRRHRMLSLEQMEEQAGPIMAQGDDEEAGQRAVVWRHVTDLSASPRLTMTMHLQEDWDYEKLAAFLQISPAAARKRCHRAFLKVSEAISAERYKPASAPRRHGN